jgi:hypothetical protein
MPTYDGAKAKKICSYMFENPDSLFLSDFSGGDALIAACDSGDFKKWIIIDALSGKHALKRMNASFECGIGELMDAVNKDMQRREK